MNYTYVAWHFNINKYVKHSCSCSHYQQSRWSIYFDWPLCGPPHNRAPCTTADCLIFFSKEDTSQIH